MGLIRDAWLARTLLMCLACTASYTNAQTFTSSAAINIPSIGTATPYPSQIEVSGASDSLDYVSVTLSGFSHTYVGDVVVLLVSPDNRPTLLMSSTHGEGDASNNTLTFIPDGTSMLPEGNANVVSGRYACTAYLPPTAVPVPAPTGPYETSLAPLLGSNPNGTWSLYVWDRFSSDGGVFAGGWSITVNDGGTSPVSTTFTYQGVLSVSGQALDGDAEVRFTLCSDPTRPVSISALAPQISRTFAGISKGLISTPLDFGAVIDTDQALWLDIQIASPPGSGFISLSPRQSITPTPQARVAQYAITAVNAESANRLAPGQVQILGDQGAINSPGVWFASPIETPINRGFVGLRNDDNIGFFTNSFTPWAFLHHRNGNTVLGDPSGDAPPERLTVNGSIQINTPFRLGFGVNGNYGTTAENTDAIYFERSTRGQNLSDLFLIIGDDPTTDQARFDRFLIGTVSGSGVKTDLFRFLTSGVAVKPNGGTWASPSDPRVKHDIVPLSGTLDKLLGLRGYSFVYNDDFIASTGLAKPGMHIGLMADEVERIFPDWISTDESGIRFVSERATTALMVEALRDLRAENDEIALSAQLQINALKADAALREAQIADLAARLAKLEALLAERSGK